VWPAPAGRTVLIKYNIHAVSYDLKRDIVAETEGIGRSRQLYCRFADELKHAT